MTDESMRHLVLAVTIISVLNALLHGAVYHRLVHRPGWPLPVRRGLAGLFLAMVVLVPVAMLGSHLGDRDRMQPLVLVGAGWNGIMLFLFGATVVAEGVRALWLRQGGGPGKDPAPVSDSASDAAPAEAPADMDRRRWIHRTVAGGAALTGLGGAGYALRSGFDLTFPEVPVAIPRLPPAFEGLTVVQLSDVHVGPLLGAPWLRPIVEKVNRLRPDLVVITGDLVDGSPRDLAAHVAPLADLRARFGKYFITGNHDFYSGADRWCRVVEGLGFRVLRNELHTVADGSARLELAGIDDFFVTGGLSVGSRLRERSDPDLATILLAHQPRSIGDAVALGADLQLAGHTHGGQIYPVAELVRLMTPYVAGLYRHDPSTQIYVSRGTGFVGPPMRFLAPAEVTRLILTSG